MTGKLGEAPPKSLSLDKALAMLHRPETETLARDKCAISHQHPSN